jgi:pyrroloquinoline quinone biosynthesis protein B
MRTRAARANRGPFVRAGPLGALLALLAACTAPHAAAIPPGAPSGPYALVLGTAQDGGLPQIGCESACCEAARRDPARRRLVTSLCVVDPRAGRRFLLDATPDLAEQVERCRGRPPGRALPGPRPPLFDAIFLTHAHLGHYLGLAWLGREAYGSQTTPVYASERMAAFLRANGPWSLLVSGGAIELRPLREGEPVRVTPEVSVTALTVPHRDELSDTLAFVVQGPRRALLYLPDIDKWERWERPIESLLSEVDVALVDGTFFDAAELPDRDLSEIPHPAITESLARFAALSAAERAKIVFTHLNHSNPAADPASDAARRVRAAGMRVAREGEVLDL